MRWTVPYDGDAELRITNDGHHVLLTVKRTGIAMPRWWRWLFGVAVTDELRLDPSDAWRMAQSLCDAVHALECRGGCGQPATAEQVH